MIPRPPEEIAAVNDAIELLAVFLILYLICGLLQRFFDGPSAAPTERRMPRPMFTDVERSEAARKESR